ncbi:MAG: hydantoinase B/oxoprolinase family protein [Solirubrobacterales bacterium]
MAEPAFDGRVYPYVPPAEPPEAVKDLMHRETTELDATDFEVLRHALWNVNIEHGTTIIRTSGSPVVVYAHDFNPVILDEWGDYVYFGPWLQYLVAASSPAVKWILENRHPSPGVEPGSMFMTNDPWIGATHQSDLAVLAPVFWEGKIFSWVGSSLHHQDLGGTAPGGFNPVAEDIFHESGVVPPVRIVENGEIRKDLEEEYMRRSRMPELVAVDLRAQIAGCRVAVDRIEDLLNRYGAPAVKAAMRKIQDDAERTFSDRLETIPDGEWSSQAFLEVAGPGDRGLYRNSIVIRKKGDRLEFSNEGTDPQIGALACTLAGWEGAIAAMVNSQLMFDQLFAIGGALRRIDFNAEPGTLTSALHPSALSLAVLTLDQCIALTALSVSKMLSCSSDPTLHREIQSSMGSATFPIAAFSGADAAGKPFASLFLDPVAAGMAGWSWRDGLDVGGWPWDPQVAMPNVEETEAFFPLLMLWRRVVPDSGGAGEYRGGNSMELASIPHGVDSMTHHMASAAHHAVPVTPLFGGLPGNVNRFVFQRDTNLRELLAAGVIPAPGQATVGVEEELPPKAFGIVQGDDDIYTLTWCGAGGYGDPLDREPEAVARDVADGMVSAAAAEKLCGVVLADGAVDVAATEARRGELRASRRSWSGSPSGRQVSGDGAPLGSRLRLIEDGGEKVIACDCGTVLAGASENWKDGALSREAPLQEGNALIPDPNRIVDGEVVIRQYACPSCLRLIDNEVCRSSEERLWDIKLGGAS